MAYLVRAAAPSAGGLPAVAGELGATYVIPIIYVPLLMITHVVALYWLLRPRPRAAPLVSARASRHPS